MENGGNDLKNVGTTRTVNEKKRNKPNVISSLFLCWVCPVLYKGNKRDVEENDLIVPVKKYDSERIGDKFERYWLQELESAQLVGRPPKLWKALLKAYWLAYMPGAFFVFIICTVRSVQPLLFGNLLQYWTTDMPMLTAGYYALSMLGLNFVSMLCQHHNSLFVLRFAMRIKVACSSLLYRKLLRVSQVSVGDVAAGKLVNLLSNDVARFDYAVMFLHYLWAVPLQVAVVLYFMYEAASYAPFVGLFSVVLIITPIQAGLTRITSYVRREAAQRTDKRIKLMSEIINGIQVIKMYAWEKPFQAVVRAARAFEMSAVKKALFVRSVFIGFMLFTERTILFVTTLTMVLTGTMVTATTIYPIQQYFSIVQINLTMILPIAIASLSEMLVALERIQGFLELDEREDLMLGPQVTEVPNNVSFNSKTPTQNGNDIIAKKFVQNDDAKNPSDVASRRHSKNEYMIEISELSASWTNSKEETETTLKNISMRVRKGRLCAIVGPVGSGKSSVLQVLLKELPASSGSFTANGTISYACQEAWLFPATVRENILFGLPYDANKYKEVCRVCCLLPDFKQFTYGDQSLVGDRGVSLSGGQKARINLARAVYREADIYLLDDPLSAVDANVGRQLFEGCINGYLRGRTVVLVTHQIHFLKAADYIVVLKEGAIEDMGTYEDLMKSDKEFTTLLTETSAGAKEGKDSDLKRPSIQRILSVKSEEFSEDQKEQVQEAEERAKGSLKWKVLLQYLASVQSWGLISAVLLALFISQGSATATDYWLSYWTNQVNAYIRENGVVPDTDLDLQVGVLKTGQYLIVYGCLIVIVIGFLFVRIALYVTTTMRASQNLHDNVFQNLISACLKFFDTNPSGRVLNRFSKDLGSMDELLPRSFLETIQMYLGMISILTLNAIALPWTLIPTSVLVVIFVVLLKWYLNAAQAVKRLEGTTKSPVFGMINSTISGLSTIRSANAQDRLLKTFDDAQDLNSSALYTYIGGSTAFGLYLDGLCLVYLGVIMAIFITIDFSGFIPLGSIGLAVSQSMVLTMLLQMAARYTADFLAQMTSVERVLEYTELPAEKDMYEGQTQPPKTWPTQGVVKFENVNMKYGPEDPLVLNNLNFEIHEGWKVGVVGRTGAGKSSLISALFRLYDLEGTIRIDGIDTNTISKQELRSKISIIPQEPVLFSASVRHNLDPFNSFADEDLWRALEQVELKEAIPALDFKVSEGGSNFSVGQRQLVCLARAILRSNRLLVMDEATANVDPQTDALIQKTIRREFSSCTVITIAHRLNTVMDSDRVLVMDKGEVVEYDHPYLLLSNPDSKFSSMVKETGESLSKVLFEMAKSKYESDNKLA